MKKNIITMPSSGYSLIEVLAAVAVFTMLLGAIYTFYINVTSNNSVLFDNLSAQKESRSAFKTMSANIRNASPSSLGAYAIDTAATSTFTYYSDIDSDGLKERVRYFLSNGTLRQGIIKPTGNPLVYVSGNETVTDLIRGVINTRTSPIFSYFDEDYDGTTAPLSAPVSILSIRLVKIFVIIDINPLKPPAPMSFTTQVSIRNLKDNL